MSGSDRRLAAKVAGSSLYSGARSVYRLAKREKDAPFSLSEKLSAWRRGFLAESILMYDPSRNDLRDYVSDYVKWHRTTKINSLRRVFDHKLMFRSLLLSMGFPQTDTVAVISRGAILMYPFDQPRRRYVSPAGFERALLEEGGRYIIKPEGGTWGTDIYLVENEDGALVRRRGLETQPFRIPTGGSATLVERMLEQGAFWRGLFPGSANTIRALTMWTPGDDAPFLGGAVQRVGTADTAPTDNWSGGGICARIDLTSGRMGAGRMHPFKGKRPQDRFTHHPDSGAPIEGAVLPHWERVRETVLQAAASLPTNRYVGWDVLVDESGTPVIIEANGNSDVNLLQIHGGLLTDPEVRRFYEAVGAL
jgi:hypothetical protein